MMNKKEKQKKKLKDIGYFIFLLVALLVFSALLGKVYEITDERAEGLFTAYSVIELEEEDIIEISYISRKKNYLSFSKREDGIWQYNGDPSMEIVQEGPVYLAKLLKNITSEYEVENPEDLSVYGIGEDAPYIEIKTSQETAKLYIGSYNETVKRTYAYLEGTDVVYGVNADIVEVLDYELSDYTSDSFE